MTKEFYKQSEVVARLGISRWTFVKWLRNGKLKLNVIRTGRLNLFAAEDVEAAIAALKAKAVPNE